MIVNALKRSLVTAHPCVIPGDPPPSYESVTQKSREATQQNTTVNVSNPPTANVVLQPCASTSLQGTSGYLQEYRSADGDTFVYIRESAMRGDPSNPNGISIVNQPNVYYSRVNDTSNTSRMSNPLQPGLYLPQDYSSHNLQPLSCSSPICSAVICCAVFVAVFILLSFPQVVLGRCKFWLNTVMQSQHNY